ncbi:hypothetical protein ACG2LH_03120 [Zhouia sp. PK063]|uniref:hypothetical protein n=1 Tax=Zhouia sp. PK063 TaxID=3373602 RepID=UPI0037B75C55
MKFKFNYLIILLLSFQSCISVKHVPKVYNQTIVNGASLKKLKVPATELFVFNNPKKLIDYKLFLSNKYHLQGYKFSDHIYVTLNDENFEMSTYTPKVTNETFDLLNFALSKTVLKESDDEKERRRENGEKEEDYIYENDQHYVMIAFSHNGEDCLSTSSLYYNLASNYLKALATEYFQSVNEN